MNYYKELNIEQENDLHEINRKLNVLNRQWQKRTNAPSIEKRQEAERILMYIGEAKEIFCNESSRKNYDMQLESSSSQEPIEVLDMLLAEMTKKAKENNYPEAMILAKKAMLKFPDSIEAKLNYCLYLKCLGRYREAFEEAKELVYRDLSKQHFYALYSELTKILYFDLENFKELEFYLNVCLQPSIDEKEPSYYQQTIIYIAMCYYSQINMGEKVFELYNVTKNYQEAFQIFEIPYLDERKKIIESMYTRTKQGDLLVTELEQINRIEQQLHEVKKIADGIQGEYDDGWIVNELQRMQVSKEDPVTTQTWAARIIFGVILLLNILFLMSGLFWQNLFSISGLGQIITFVVCYNIGFKDTKPLYIRNRRFVG